MNQYLQVFIQVAEKQNFSRVAEDLHMTQPAVSQYIRILETKMGTKLLDRTSKQVHLNKAGEIVYHYSKNILSLYDQMQYLIDDLSNHASGPLKIGSSYSFGEYVLPKLIAKMLDSHPKIDPSVTICNTKDIVRLVKNHQLDIGIIEGSFKNTYLIQETFSEDSMVIVASPNHKLAQSNMILKKDLSQATWVIRENGSGTREFTEKAFDLLNISPSHHLYFSSTQAIKESVESGIGISLLSRWTIQKELKIGSLVEINLPELPIKRTFSFIRSSPFQTKALEIFIKLLKISKEL